MSQLRLPGLDLPKMYTLEREDQHTLWYLSAKEGSMPVHPRADYNHLTAVGLVVVEDKTVSLTKDGWAVIDAEISRSLGTTFKCGGKR